MGNENSVNGTVSNGTDNNSDNAGSNQTGEIGNDTVAYSTFEKVLGQHKKTQQANKELTEKLRAYELKEQEAEKKRLEEKGEYKKLLELREKELQKEREEKEQYQKNMIESHKLQLFKDTLKKELNAEISDSRYYDYVDTKNILVDPDTSDFDKNSVKEVVYKFAQEHPKLYDQISSGDMPSNAPQGQAKLTYDQWLKLPTVKEKKARLHEVVNNN